MDYKAKDLSKVRDSVAYVKKESKAMCTKRFIEIMVSDAEVDYVIGELLSLFATDMPKTYGGWAHHGH